MARDTLGIAPQDRGIKALLLYMTLISGVLAFLSSYIYVTKAELGTVSARVLRLETEVHVRQEQVNSDRKLQQAIFQNVWEIARKQRGVSPVRPEDVHDHE